MQKTMTWLIIGCLAASFVLGALLFGADAPREVREARTEAAIESAHLGVTVKASLVYLGLGLVGLAVLAGAVAIVLGALYVYNRHVAYIPAGEHGLYGAIRNRNGIVVLDRLPGHHVTPTGAAQIADTEAGRLALGGALMAQLGAALTRPQAKQPNATVRRMMQPQQPMGYIAPPDPPIVIIEGESEIAPLLGDGGFDE